MRTYTWVPGSDSNLDSIFEEAREEHYHTIEHRLKENYSKNSFDYAGIVANTISFNENGDPEICSTISTRTCWPHGAYRILNRTWKHRNKKPIMLEISQAMGQATLSQVTWLNNNVDCKLYFISRQTNNWMKWVQRNFKKQFDLDFKIGTNKYLTCPDECNDACWQHILYNGNSKILKSWKFR